MLVNSKRCCITHRSRSDMDLVVEMWKNECRESGARFPTIPTTEKDLVIDNWKYAKLKSAHIFPLINNLMMINFYL